VQTISGLHSGPGGVDAGEVGLAADSFPLPLVAGGMLVVVAAGVASRRLTVARAGR